MTTRDHDPLDDELSAAARTLHREWDSPRLWPSVSSRLRPAGVTAWYGFAAAAVLVIAVSVWMTSRIVRQTVAPPAQRADQASSPDRLLSDEAFAEIGRAEAQYARALDELARVVAPKLEMPDSQLLVSLRERLTAIDAAIAEARMQIDVNPFNAQLRRQLLFIFQEKRRTLEQVQEYEHNTL